MHALDAHVGTVIAACGAALALLILAAVILQARSAALVRRAVAGARPVPRPARFDPHPRGGLRVTVPIVNTAPWPARALRVSARVAGAKRQTAGPEVTLMGDGATINPAFDWPMGVLEGDVALRWEWRDDAGRHHATWHGTLHVPEQAFPTES
ncbi:MAG: hypothetical protein U0Y82_16070 [Thermoleophilia bacterium]